MAHELSNAGDSGRADVGFVESLAPHSLSAAELASFEGELCFCMVDYEVGDDIVVTPCHHRYHEACLKQWLTTNVKCPVCNHKFPEELHPGVLRVASARAPPPAYAAVAAVGGDVALLVDAFDFQLQEGDSWLCPECVELEGVPADDDAERHENGCRRCGMSRTPWNLISTSREAFYVIAQCIVDNWGVSQLNRALPAVADADADDDVEPSRTRSTRVDMELVAVPLSVRRDYVIKHQV